MFKYREYTITGIVISRLLYMNFERGSTSLGSLDLSPAFAYINRGGFDTGFILPKFFQSCKDHYSHIYSDEYNDLVDATEDKPQTATDKPSDLRVSNVIKDAKEKLSDGQKGIR